jgi:glycosyltransferase involved in cell wall biosynthesis
VSKSDKCVNFAVCGKFHVLNHIPYLRNTGYLNRLYYSHPRLVEPGVYCEEYVRLPLKEYLIQGHSRVTKKYLDTMDSIYSGIWARSALARWVSAPLLHFILLGHSLPLIHQAKQDGAHIVAGAVNTHPENRRAIMEAEAERWGLRNTYTKLAPHEERVNEEIAHTDILLAPSRCVADTYIKHARPVHTVVLPFAANVARFKPSPLRRQRDLKGPLKIMTVGQIGLRKGQLYVLEALTRFPLGSIEYTMIGAIDPEIRDRLSKYRSFFKHVPRIANHDLVKIYQDHDAYVLTSLEEGLAGSMCEAMASGLSVACTPETGSVEILTDGSSGYIVPSRSVDAIEGFLAFALANRETLVETGLAAATKARSEVNWENYANNLMRIYDGLLSR